MDLSMLQDEMDIDDSVNNTPIVGLNKPLSLDKRLEYRLSHLLGTNIRVSRDNGVLQVCILPTTGTIHNRHHSSSINEHVKSLQKFSKDLQKVLTQLVTSKTDSQKDEADNDLWDIILLHVYQHTDSCVKSMQNLFTKYDVKFSDLVAQMLGLEDTDDHVSARDTEVGDIVIRLHQLVGAYNGSVAQNNKLIESAWEIARNNNDLAERLRQLLPSRFAAELFEAVSLLGHSLRTKYTIVRAATDFGVRCAKVRFGNPSETCSGTSTSSRKTYSRKTTSPKRPSRGQDQSIATPSAVNKTPAEATPAAPIPNHLNEDQYSHMAGLDPMYAQAVAMLIDSILRYKPVPIGCDAYYLFGFVTCKDQSEERALCGYYRTFLESAQTPIVLLFEKIVRALQLGTLTGLLHNKGLQSLKTSHPYLHDFLMVKPHHRPSFFRLIQFIRDRDNDEPTPVLKRDYGFKLCTQREHVAVLKNVYGKILTRVQPVRLHDACRFGRLREVAIEVLGSIDGTARRLLQNDYPHPFLGFDNNEGMEQYAKPLFKKSLKH